MPPPVFQDDRSPFPTNIVNFIKPTFWRFSTIRRPQLSADFLRRHFLRRIVATPFFKGIFLALTMGLAIWPRPLSAAAVAINLEGRSVVAGGAPLILTTSDKLPATDYYTVTFEGTLHGSGGLASLVPAKTTFAQLLDRMKAGASKNVLKSFANPGSHLPIILYNTAIQSGVSATGKASVMLPVILINQDGSVSVSLAYNAADRGAQLNGSLIFDSGAKLKIYTGSGLTKLAGAYSGLFEPFTDSPANMGVARFTVSGDGAFSATFTVGGKTFPAKGAFKLNGTTPPISGPDGMVVLASMNVTSRKITAQLQRASQTVATLNAVRPGFSAAVPFDRPGAYTMALDPAALGAGQTAATLPRGNGFGILQVTASGTARFAGTLADGTKFTLSASLTADRTFPGYTPLYTAAGVLKGTLTFHDAASINDVDGALRWIKPPRLADKRFAKGFSTNLAAVGSTYRDPGPTKRATGYSAGQLRLGNGNLVEFTNRLTIAQNNAVYVVPPVTNDLKLSITRSNGAFSGSFLPDGTSQRIPFNGVLLQKQKRGAGFFLGTPSTGTPVESGYVRLRPAP